MRKFISAAIIAMAAFVSLQTQASSAEMKKYYFMFFSNPVKGQEESYMKWYTGQHMHDLLNIDGITAAQFFKVADQQFPGTQPQKYMMIWELDTDNLAAAFARVNKGLQTGTTVTSDALDGKTANSETFTPITNRLTKEEINGQTPDEVSALAMKGLN